MKISVALCTYNGEKFLSEQLDSILDQSVKPDEIIVCDDGSKDSTISILENYKDKYKGMIKIYQNRINLGFVKNFEKAVSYCTGEIIFLSDQDDIWYINKIEEFVKVFENNSECLYIFSDAMVTDEIGNNMNYTLWEVVGFNEIKQKQFTDDIQNKMLLFRDNFVQGASLAIRSKSKKFILPFSENYFHDYWIATILSLISRNAGALIREPLISYRRHDSQNLGLQKDSRNFFQKQLVHFGNLKNFFRTQISETTNRIEILKEFRNQLFSVAEFSIENRNFLNDYIYFYQIRNQMYSKKKITRFKMIMKLMRKGYYKRFSHSNFVVLKDIIIKLVMYGEI